MKTPTQKQKIEMYEKFLHAIQMYEVCGRNDLISFLLTNACAWSFAHRSGNGELSETKQQELINKKFYKLLDVPDIVK